MANSLRSKIKKLRHSNNISEHMCNELLEKLEGHDRELRAKAIDEFLHNAETKICDRILQNQARLDFASGLSVANRIIDEIAEQMKAGE